MNRKILAILGVILSLSCLRNDFPGVEGQTRYLGGFGLLPYYGGTGYGYGSYGSTSAIYQQNTYGYQNGYGYGGYGGYNPYQSTLGYGYGSYPYYGNYGSAYGPYGGLGNYGYLRNAYRG